MIKPPIDEHPFNYPDYIEQALKEFKNIDWTGKVLQDIIDEYGSRFASLPLYKTTVKKDTVLFRGRTNEGDALFKTLSEISIKPKEYVKSFGRANIPNQSVFYCSTNEETVVREVTQWYINDSGRAQNLITRKIIGKNWNATNSRMTISAWHVKEDLHLALLFGNEEKRNIEVQECHKQRVEVSKNSNFEKSRHLILDFFSSEFGKLDVKHESEYWYSAYYAFQVYNNAFEAFNNDNLSVKFDGVKYASIANNFRGENIAICEESFRNKIEFLGANFCFTLNPRYITLKNNDNTALISIANSAKLKNDQSFDWVETTDDYDYIIKVGKEYYPFIVPGDRGIRLPLKRIGAR